MTSNIIPQPRTDCEASSANEPVGLFVCHFCHRRFKPTSFNRVYIGGKGEVDACDKCLELERVNK